MGSARISLYPAAALPSSEVMSAIFWNCVRIVTINVSVNLGLAGKLNQRQLWFLGELQNHKEVRAEDIATAWEVALRTAKRDVAGLSAAGMIRFVGARKTGWYEAAR